MSDVVVTVPKTFTHPAAPGKVGLAAWLAEGDPAGASWSGQLWAFGTYGPKPDVRPGDRVYVVCEGRLVGYSPLVRLSYQPKGNGAGNVTFIRGGGAVACTIDKPIIGFRGWKYRWWNYEDEKPLDLSGVI